MLALTLMCLLVGQHPLSVDYQLSYDPANPGRIDVSISFPADATVLIMPRAIPMGYDDVHYDRFVHDVAASAADGTSLAVTRESEGPRWKLGDGSAAARRVHYVVDVDAMEREIVSASDTSKARPGYAGLLGYSIFAYAEGLEAHPVELTVSAPNDWPVFLTLAPRTPPVSGIASATAIDFYALADAQVAMGPDLQVLQLDAAVPLFVAQYAEQPSDASILGSQAVTALDALATYFGSVPFPHYTVHVEFLEPRSPDHRYGFSMEHMESCTIFFDTSRVISGTGNESAEPGRHLYNLAHHISHSWIPKRAAPAGYFPWSWELSPVLDSIWFSEGWGQYAGAAALAEEGGLGDAYREELVDRRFRASLATAPSFLSELDLVQVSRIASTRYSEDFRTGRNVFSRGGLMAYEMDEAIRQATDDKKSLRDLLQLLMAEGRNRPLDLDRLPDLCLEATGVDVSSIYRRWLGPLHQASWLDRPIPPTTQP
jgi:predicted metalloprotease with PDZ domain